MSEPAPEVRPVTVNANAPTAPGPVSRARNATSSWVASHQPNNAAQPSPLLPSKTPQFLTNRQTILYAWMISMFIISWDDWHNHHILPRPSRMWSATWFYLILILVGMVDALVPLANALGIGYTITLMYQYYQGGGA